MKRGELTVGMTVEDKNGREFVVVSTDGWVKSTTYQRRPTGHSWGSHDIMAIARPDHTAQGVLVVPQRTLAYATEGEAVSGDVLQLRSMFPVGTAVAATRARHEALKASVEADEKRDRELVEQVNHYWGDVPHLIATCGVHLDGGLLTEREVQILVTMILCGQNRKLS